MDLIEMLLAVKKALEELGVKKERGKVLWNGKLTAIDDGYSAVNFDNPIGLEVGKTYIVTTDSGTYTSIAKEYGNTIVIGNTAFMGGDNSGESYCVVEAVSAEAGSILDINGGTSATISTPETIHPIDPKYLPEMKPTVEVWDAASVIDEREIDNAMDKASVAGKYSVSCTVAYDFDGVLTKLKTTVESGGAFMASITHGNLIPVCYSDTAITFVYCNGTARLDITISDNTVKYIGFAPV